MKITFIIQARLGSTRLPGKILKAFYQNKSILDLLIQKLKLIPDSQIILATSTSSVNDPLENIAKSNGIFCFRGSEEDVLQRFIDAATLYQSENIIRICSDNPFLDLKAIIELIAFAKQHPEYDYISFNVNGIPSIKTHYGFWTEYVQLSALKKVAALTKEKIYHEHVTNFIYTHPEYFNFYLLETPSELTNHNNIRLTIDTENDFNNAQIIYSDMVVQSPYPTIKDIILYLDSHPNFYKNMEQEILKNSK